MVSSVFIEGLLAKWQIKPPLKGIITEPGKVPMYQKDECELRTQADNGSILTLK